MYEDIDLKVPWGRFGLFVCTSMEHFHVGFDLEMLKRTPENVRVLWSMADFRLRPGSEEGFEMGLHRHPYKSEEYIRTRFDPYLSIQSLQKYETCYLMYAQKTVPAEVEPFSGW